METGLIIGLVLIVLMVAYIIGGIVNNGSEAILGCLIPALIVGAVFLGIYLLTIGPIYVVNLILNFFS